MAGAKTALALEMRIASKVTCFLLHLIAGSDIQGVRETVVAICTAYPPIQKDCNLFPSGHDNLQFEKTAHFLHFDGRVYVQNVIQRQNVAHFNFCRILETLRTTPATAQRLTDHVWTIGELLTACLDNAPAKPRKVHRRFTVIQGGLVLQL